MLLTNLPKNVVEKPRSYADLVECVTKYESYNDGRIFPINTEKALFQMQSKLANGAQLRLIREDDKIVAWIMYAMEVMDLNGQKAVRQLFYYSNASPIRAVKYAILLHECMLEWGRKKYASIGVSTCSHEDTEFKLCKILARAGWEQQGYLAYKHL